MIMKTENNPCSQHDELLDYLYDELAAPQATAFVRHLDECADCHTEFQGLRRLRTDLRAWDTVTAPHLDIVIPRSPWQALKECFTLIPAWGRGAFALSAAAALLLMTFGATSLLRGNPPTQLVVSNPPVNTSATSTVVALTPELKAQVEAQVAAAVTQAVEHERQAIRSQLAEFESRHVEQQQRVQTVARQLRTLQTRYDELLAEQQPSLRRMMAEYNEAGNER